MPAVFMSQLADAVNPAGVAEMAAWNGSIEEDGEILNPADLCNFQPWKFETSLFCVTCSVQQSKILDQSVSHI